MITRDKLQRRVDARKEVIENEVVGLRRFHDTVISFVNEIKSRSVIYNLIKNLSVWKELERLIEEKEQ